MVCFKCQNDVVPSKVGFTWWGGLMGSSIVNHVECPRCGARFNGKTGKDNTGPIAIYMVVVSLIAGGLMFAIFKGVR